MFFVGNDIGVELLAYLVDSDAIITFCECGNSVNSVDFGKSGKSVEFGKSGKSGNSCESRNSGDFDDSRDFCYSGEYGNSVKR